MKYQKLLGSAFCIATVSSYAADSHSSLEKHNVGLKEQTGFFRLSFDNIKMPNHIQDMGLLGVNYFADFTPTIYGGIGAYGSVSGSQGGLFTLGFEGGLHHALYKNIWGDAGVYVGGGGGHSSLVGGGLLVRPHVGLEYDFKWARLGVHYSYIDFPTGDIRSSQFGLDLDIPYDFYYINYYDVSNSIFNFDEINLFNGDVLGVQRNDFGLFVQSYMQVRGTKNVYGAVQDGNIGLVGAELDHYITQNFFGFAKASGAFSGVPNGYMDILGGIGYHWRLGSTPFALVPQAGVGAGGGGTIDTGGGVILQPSLGMEWSLTRKFSARLSGGYLWAPRGQLKAYTATGEILYHLDLATGHGTPVEREAEFTTQAWRLELLNQTYTHPQRVNIPTTSAINLIVFQIDQIFSQNFFLTYQAASAYSGTHAGGLASGMIGPGIQTAEFFNHRMQLFGELLVGAEGGGGLALGSGSVYEPVVGLNLALNQTWGLQASAGQIKSFTNRLSTPVVNLGLTVRFGTLYQQ